MFYEGLLNFLNFIVTPPDQPQKYIAFAAAILLLGILVALIDWKKERGIVFTAFTAFALLASVFSVCFSAILLQGMRNALEAECAGKGVGGARNLGFVGLRAWYILLVYFTGISSNYPSF